MKKIIYIFLGLSVGYTSFTLLQDILSPSTIQSRMDDIKEGADFLIKNGYKGRTCDLAQNQEIYNALSDKSKFEPYVNDEHHFLNLFRYYPDCIKKATLKELSHKTRQGDEITVYGIYRGENEDYMCELQIAFLLNTPKNARKESSECHIAIFYKNFNIPLGTTTKPSFY